MKTNLIIGIIVLIVILFCLTGCKDNGVSKNLVYNKTTNKTTNKTNTQTTTSVDYEAAAQKQMATPEKGETVAIITVKNFGDIKVKFFKDIAPKAVENFVTHSKNGYYDGTIFHRVMEEFMIQGGDPEGNGTGGESIWGKDFGEELDLGLVPYRGALCMASRGTGTTSIGSQFFIVQANYDEEMASALKQYKYPDGLIEQYKKYGGYMSLYQGYTVFGQVFEGMDVVDKIASVEKGISASGELSVPIEKIVIDKINIVEY